MNFNLEITIFDYIVIIFTFIFVIFSFWKGFINSILSLLTWVGSIFITIFTYTYLSSFLENILNNIDFISELKQFNYYFSIVSSIPIIFLVSLFILKRFRKILNSDLDKQILGLILDKFFGILYGFLFSYVFFSTILFFTDNNDITILYNIHNFLIDKANILNLINNYNDNIFSNFSNSVIED